jgi:hypothetical protein
VEPDPDTHGVGGTVILEGPLDRRCRLDRIGRGREHGEEGVAARRDLEAAPLLERCAHDPAMSLEHRNECVAKPRCEPRAVLDVTEEESDGPGRELTYRDNRGVFDHEMSLPEVPTGLGPEYSIRAAIDADQLSAELVEAAVR